MERDQVLYFTVLPPSPAQQRARGAHWLQMLFVDRRAQKNTTRTLGLPGGVLKDGPALEDVCGWQRV